MKNQRKKVFVTWFMRSYGTAFMGNCASLLTLDKAMESQEILKELWDTAKENVEIHCIYPTIYARKDNDKNLNEFNKDRLKKLKELKNKYPDFKSEEFWDVCHIMDYKDQIQWFETSWGENLSYINIERITSTNGLFDLKSIIEELKRYIYKYVKGKDYKEFYINFQNTPSETQIAWYILASEPNFPKNIHFYQFSTIKKERGDLGTITYREVSKTPLTDYYIDNTFISESKIEKEVQKKLNFWINNQQNFFTILLLGERGTGKTNLIHSVTDKSKQGNHTIEVIDANCAYFPPDSNMTEAELFGTVKGAFTGATDKKGLFFAANGKILFLDEIHHLSKGVQAKLLTALQTDETGNYTYRKVGSSTNEKPVKFQLICASNRTIGELKELMHDDFFDRISQRIIRIPNIKEAGNIKSQFDSTWKQMGFSSPPNNEDRKSIINWLKTISLPGNYRTLQQICISISDYISDKEKLFTHPNGLLGYVQEEYNKRIDMPKINIELTADQQDHKAYIREFKKQLAQKYLIKYNENITAAAKALDLSRDSFYKWLYFK